ncbi:hypothetical protein [Methylobacterium sp. V23]|uniref:hypothetical protein n=1 Tax=Methylobacterium sp. V23 TaxID=2044878 RepID=UPI0011B0C113|nr:hypothetical protein [Methylobacterium sp. V23]
MSETEAPKKRGRPAKFAGERTRGPLTVRLRDEVRSELERAAVQNGRSLSEEIEMRMEVSLAQKNQLRHEWGEDIFRIAAAMAGSLTHIEDWREKTWTEDDEAYSLFCGATCELIKNYRDRVLKNRRSFPRGDINKMSNDERAQYFAALGGLAPPRPPVETIVTDED